MKIYYVDIRNGSNITGDGSKERPFNTEGPACRLGKGTIIKYPHSLMFFLAVEPGTPEAGAARVWWEPLDPETFALLELIAEASA